MNIFSLCHHIYIDKTQLKGRFRHLRITLFLGFPVLTNTPPMNILCQLIPLACLVLNLLLKSRINPNISSYTQVNGSYDFNATPVALPGTCVVVYEKTAVCGSWAIRGIDGWYLGHTLHHCICFEVFEDNKAHSRIKETIEILPHHFNMNFPSSAENAIVSAKQLEHALLNSAPSAPFQQLGYYTIAAIQQLPDVLKRQRDTMQELVRDTAISKPP